MSNLYKKLPDELLVQFYEEINKNINEGILTEAMCIEVELIDEIFKDRGLKIDCNYLNICNSVVE
ncbi:hypothetical protein BKP35_00760 [Anaerobacillus arseniciselenatis]|uniref:Uncharacterized protein n=1 Tax=Anaerobacillus arseniciselenatis TaxID=85682 RepID=A0A1S2LSR6_9BACI|nr:hypothetical protein [Anaerobacillus arseniciselenatis]OIJ15558.1 hypothetical protein BKP35_00760 [Anaerobacillus arseniciselenatis]